MNQNPKGHGYFRKSKAYGLVCGIALLGALMVAQTAKADEVVETKPEVTITENPATNLSEAQPLTPAENTSLTAEAGTQTGTLVNDVTSPTLDQATSKAEEAGVTVTTENKVTYDSLEKAQSDLSKQETAVKEVTAKQEANTTAIDNAVAENKAIDKANADEKVRVDALNKQGEADTKAKNEAGQKAVDETNAKAKAEADAENAKRQADYDKKVADREAIIASNTEKEAKHSAEQKAYETARSEFEKAEKAYQEAKKSKEQAEAENKTIEADNAKKQVEFEEAKRVFDLAKAEYDKAVEERKKAIATGATNDSAYQAQLAQYNKDKLAYDKALAEYKKAKEARDKAVEASSGAQADYEVKLAAYNRQKQEYDVKIAEYNEAIKSDIERAKTTTSQEGYLSQPYLQSFIYKKEPNAKTTITGDVIFVSENGANGYLTSGVFGNVSDAKYDTATRPVFSQTGFDPNLSDQALIIAKKGIPFTVISELQNTTFNGRRIARAEYEYTFMDFAGDEILVGVFKDPTENIKFGSGETVYQHHDNRIRFRPKFFYEDGKQVDFSENTALIALGSLNAGYSKDANYTDYHEYTKVKSGGEFVKINGSVITMVGDKVRSDGTDIIAENVDPSSPYFGWDKGGSPVAYRGAGVVKLVGQNVELEFGSQVDLFQWWTFNADLPIPVEKARNKPTPPTPPTKPAVNIPDEPKEPKAPTPPTKPTVNIPDEPKEPKAPTPPTIVPLVDVPSIPNKPTPPVAPTPPKLEEVPPAPIKPEMVTPVVKTFTPEVYVPVVPKVTPYVTVPNKEIHKVAVHPVEVKQTPTNVKAVENSDMVSINGQLVPKNDLVSWKLENTALKAGRQETTSYTMTDPLPSGFVVDMEATEKANPSWVFGRTETGTTVISATKSTLALLNKDLSKDVSIPVVTIIGRPVNDGGTYENTFKTTIKTPKGQYTTTSNTPVIYTPGDDSRTYNGQVIVRYRTEDGDIEIRKNVIDVEDGKVGSTYDTTDNRPDIIAFEGKRYERTPKVVGNETGQVVKGKTYVTYYYKLIPETPDKGSVIVHYVDEDGTPIKNDVVDTPVAPVGTDYDTTDNKPKKIITNDGVEYELVPNKTKGNEDGKVVSGTTEVTYVYKRTTPKPPTPTPHDNLIQPKKDVVDANGVSINGKQVLVNTPINYVLTQDFDQYKGMTASKEAIGKGFIYIDDYLDTALDGKSMMVKSIMAKNGDDVSSLLEMHHVLSKDALEGKLAELVKASGISPVGEFYLWVAKNPEDFFKAYVQKGLDITYNLSFKIKEQFVGTITNQSFQIDFGNGYYGNIVTNEVPELKVNKDVMIDGKAVDKGTIKLGDSFEYVLEGWVIPADRGYDINEYRFVDVMQSSHDEYQGFKVTAKVDITLADGTVIAKGTDLSQYVAKTYNVATGTFELKFNDEFLAQIPRSSAFGSDVILQAKRIKSGTVENEFTLYVNGIPVKSDKVITETPEPPKPPQPKEPKKEVPPTPSKPVLPKTGDAGSLLAVLGTALSGLGLVGLKRKKD